jgi:mono/diheme cytochrome c family protein
MTRRFRRIAAPLFAIACVPSIAPSRAGPEKRERPTERLHADEDAIIAATIRAARRKAALVQKERGGPMRRDTHAKPHGCLRGTFTIAPTRGERVRFGLFAADGSFPVWARFSSAAATVGSDTSADVHGVAFKLVGTKGAKLRDNDRERTVDFLLNTPAVFPTANARDYAELARATLSKTKLAAYLVRHPRIALRLAAQQAAGRLVANPLFATYYSGGAFSFGESAVKYRLAPCRDGRTLAPLRGADYLRASMAATLRGGEGCFVLSAQFFENERETPIEDFTKKWKTRFHPLGTLVFPAQRFDSAEQEAFCENLSFNPWRTFVGHRPLGSLNRVRRALYDEIAAFRRAFNKAPVAEPTGEETFEGSPAALSAVPAPAAVVPPTIDSQGLTAAEQKMLFHLPQGAEVLPFSVLRALEDPKTARPFLENIERFGLLRDPDDPLLPVGMTSAASRDLGLGGIDRAMGVNCASCHVGEVRYRGKAMRIIGAPSFFDAQSFAVDLKDALAAVVKDPLRLARFVGRLLRPSAPADAAVIEGLANVEAKRHDGGIFANLRAAIAKGWRQFFGGVRAAAKRIPQLVKALLHAEPSKIRSALKALARAAGRTSAIFEARIRALGHKLVPATTRAGHGRLDAFGGGLQKVFPNEAPPPNAPVSTPQLWDLERTKWYHYDGNTNSAIERNVGNAIGLGVVYEKAAFASTLRPKNLYKLEEIFRKTKPPTWPDFLPPIDASLVARGQEVYSAQCASCHDARAGELMSPRVIGTDEAASRTNLLLVKGPDGKPTNALLLGAKAGRAILERAFEEHRVTPEQRKRFAAGRPDPGTWRATGKMRIPFLTAVWATAPYLHNGSVPTLYDLLTPPERRPRKFLVGSYEFDPVKVGYVTRENDVAKSILDTSIPGNGNGGHTAGANLSEPERMALIEYLKTR